MVAQNVTTFLNELAASVNLLSSVQALFRQVCNMHLLFCMKMSG